MTYMCFIINICAIATGLYLEIREFDIFTDGRYTRKIRFISFARYLGIAAAFCIVIYLDWYIFGIKTYDDLHYYITTMRTR